MMRWILIVMASCLMTSCSKKAETPETVERVEPTAPRTPIFSTVVSTQGAKDLSRSAAETFAIGFLREHGSDLTQFDVMEPDRVSPLKHEGKTGWAVYWESRHEPLIHDGVEVSIVDGVARIRYED